MPDRVPLNKQLFYCNQIDEIDLHIHKLPHVIINLLLTYYNLLLIRNTIKDNNLR